MVFGHKLNALNKTFSVIIFKSDDLSNLFRSILLNDYESGFVHSIRYDKNLKLWISL